MNRAGLFLVACALGGVGGALGSMVGNAFGKSGLWAGGILGGLLASMLVARIALWRRWIVRSQYWPTTLGTATGFLVACAVAENPFSTPLGPIEKTPPPAAAGLLPVSPRPLFPNLPHQPA